MTIVVDALKRVGILEETAMQFGTDQSGGSFIDLPFRETTESIGLNSPKLDPDTAVQLKDDYPRQILGPKGGQFDFETLAFATGIVAAAGTPSATDTNCAMIKLLKIAFGGVDGGNEGSTATGTPSTTVVEVADATDFAVGGVCGWVNASGDLEVRCIRDITGDELTVRPAFSAAPVATDIIYAGTTIYLTEDPATSLQCKIEGKELQDRWLLSGGQVESLGFNFPIGELPTMTWSWRFANWITGADASTPFVSAALGRATYSNFQPIAYRDSTLIIQAVGTDTIQTINAPVINYESRLRYIDARSSTGVNTIAQRVRAHDTPIWAIDFTLYHEDFTWLTARESERTTSLSRYYALHQIGKAAGKTMVIDMPDFQVTEFERVAENELAAARVRGECRIDEEAYAAGNTAEQEYSAVRLHFI